MTTPATPANTQGSFSTDVQPLAQIIMLDAAHGDSNIIDICAENLDPNGAYLANSWGRFLIDSGPGPLSAPAPQNYKDVADNLVRVLKEYKYPRIEGKSTPLEEPIVRMVQFTHTDADHCGGGWALFDKLKTDKTLQKHFSETLVAFHRPPERDPQWALTFAPADPKSITHPYTLKCEPLAWKQGLRIDFKQANIHFRYMFTIGGTAGEKQGKSTVQIAAEDLKGTEITVSCEVFLYRRAVKRYTTQLIPFTMRAAHKNIFTVTNHYNIDHSTQTPVLTMPTRSIKRRNPGTLTPVKAVEKEKVDQMYYRILEAVKGVVDLDKTNHRHQGRLLQKDAIWVPQNNETKRYGLGTMRIAGPTRTIHHELIGDMIHVEYDQGPMEKISKRQKGNTPTSTPNVIPDPPAKDDVLHNMASIVTLFCRWSDATDATDAAALTPSPNKPALSMLFTGDAHDRECQVRDTVVEFAGPIEPRAVNVLKIPHHGSLCSTSVEFYNRITADVYLVCAKQNNNGLPSLPILEAIVRGTARQDGGGRHASIFFSNPDSLWNIQRKDPDESLQSNLNMLLSGTKKPGARLGTTRTYNYTCYILKHRVKKGESWTKDTTSKDKNAGIILFGQDKTTKKLVVTADPMWWDKWDEARISGAVEGSKDDLWEYRKSRG